MHYLVTSFLSIVRYVSEDRVLCEEVTRIKELFSDEFDDLDFELVLCAFEATHRVAFSDALWKQQPEDYDQLTIEEFLEQFIDPAEQRDPLFVAQRFVMLRETLDNADYDREEEPGQDD